MPKSANVCCLAHQQHISPVPSFRALAFVFERRSQSHADKCLPRFLSSTASGDWAQARREVAATLRGCGCFKCSSIQHKARQYVVAFRLLVWMHVAHGCVCFVEVLAELLLWAASLSALKAYCTALSPCELVLLFAAGTVESSSSGQTSLPADLAMTSPSQALARP